MVSQAADSFCNDTHRDWCSGFMACNEEADGYWLRCSRGQLPPDLEGTYFR
jgi:carotenoid cleavage dioxygenase-like enzyme